MTTKDSPSSLFPPLCETPGVNCFYGVSEQGVRRLTVAQSGTFSAPASMGMFHSDLKCPYGVTPDGCVTPGAVTSPYEDLGATNVTITGPPYYASQ